MYEAVPTMARFHSRLKQVMLEYAANKGEPLSQRQLAEKTGIAISTVSRWYLDNDIRAIEPNTLNALLRFFGVKFDDLVTIEDDEPASPAEGAGHGNKSREGVRQQH